MIYFNAHLGGERVMGDGESPGIGGLFCVIIGTSKIDGKGDREEVRCFFFFFLYIDGSNSRSTQTGI